MENLEELKSELIGAVDGAADLAALDAARVGALGKKGRITGLMKTLGGLDPEARKEAGAALNALKESVAEAIEARRRSLERDAMAGRLEAERLDVSLPIRPEETGHVHPITQTIDELTAIFAEMGYSVAEGPDIEDDFHNFTALNMPEEHPARQMHDTFYLPHRPDAEGGSTVLRTHTSPVQIRTMMSTTPPIRIIVPGRTYRSDYDMTHTPMFHQVEGLVVDETTHMGHLKGCLIDFCRAFFDIDDLPLRFRPSFFPSPSHLPRSISAVVAVAASWCSEITATGWRSSVAAWSTPMCWKCRASIPAAIRDLPSAWASSGSPC